MASTKPIDLQVALPRAPEAGRVQQIQQQHPLTRQAQFADELQQRVEREKKQVHQLQKPEELKVREEGKRKNGSGGGEPDRRPGTKRAGKKADEESGRRVGLGAVIDIKL